MPKTHFMRRKQACPNLEYKRRQALKRFEKLR
jgi:hypothetical protein